MKDKNLSVRKNPRLKNFDYSTPGAYFITICTKDRKKILSDIVGAIHESPEIRLKEQGKIVDGIISHLPSHLGAVVDKYVIMPNHIHMILLIENSASLRAIRESPLHHRSVISKTVGYIKMNSSKRINSIFGRSDIWQRSYHDHVIRNREDYINISKYIYNNPSLWQEDCFCSEVPL